LKKIPTYKLSNKKILISPKRMITNAPIVMIGAIIGAVLIIALIASQYNPQEPGSKASGTFKKFSSDVELKNYIKENTASGEQSRFFDALGGILAVSKDGPGTMAAELSSGAGADTFSQTNVQVQGVDEPDIVKNDGKYIYTISGNRVIIVNAFPASEMENVSSIDFPNGVQNMFVNGDKLIVFGNSYGTPVPYGDDAISAVEDIKMAESSASLIAPCRYGGCGFGSSFTNIYVYDISERENPVLENNISVEGNYAGARMIDDYIYLVSSKYVNLDNPIPPYYIMDGISSKIAASDVYYYPHYEDNSFSFTSIFALNLDNGEVNKKVYLTGATTSTIYVSEKNIFLTYQKMLSSKDYNEKLLNEGIIPILPSDLMEKAEDIMNTDMSINEKYGEVIVMVQDYSLSLKGNEKEEFDSALNKAMNEFAQNISKEYEKTVVMKIGINEEDIDFSGSGEVPGHLLNQFSMDEFEGNLRIATTTGQSWNGESLNHIFVLDENMEIKGSLQGIAPGESIYSARFLGNRAFLVTFKQVDPFFVVDLSEPENPKVLGYLKIPGYSQYLHPYDENHIIGIGKDVNESIDADKVHSPNAVYYTAIGGVKISLFDVSDVEHPVETGKISIGDRGSDSYALQDHKAFLFDKSRNLLVIPITVNEIRDTNYGYGNYKESYPVWQGAYVFKINSDEVSYRGRISHIDFNESAFKPAKDESIGAERADWNGIIWKKVAINSWKSTSNENEYQTNGDYQIDSFPGGAQSIRNKIYDYKTQVQRSLFMDDTLYTISPSTIKANGLDDLEEINHLDLNYSELYYSGPMVY